MAAKKTEIRLKPNIADQKDHFVSGNLTTEAQPIESQEESILNATNESEKTKMKRLTLDISEDLHKAIKMKSVSLGIPMVDMLRTLLDRNYGNS